MHDTTQDPQLDDTNASDAAEGIAARPHAKRSASQLGNIAICPGYRPKLSKKKHWVTAQGERGHGAMETGDDGDLESNFEQQMVATCRDYVAKLPRTARIVREVKVDTIEGRFGYFDELRIHGTVDMLGPIYTGVADLCDWKFVRMAAVKDAEINLQGKDYVVGIFDDPQYYFLNVIHVHFVAPRMLEVTTHTFTRADVPRLKLEIYAVLRRARRSDNRGYRGEDLCPTYEACRYCGAAGNCRALRTIAAHIQQQYAPEGSNLLASLPTETHASKVTDLKVRAQLQGLAGLMEEWAASVRYHNLTAALNDTAQTPEGYVIDWAKGRRGVTSVDALVLVAREFGLSDADLLESAKLTWGTLEQKLRDHAPSGQKKRVVQDFEGRLIELGAVERPEPTPQLRKARPQAA